MIPVNLRLKRKSAHKMWFRVSSICLLTLGLAACDGGEGDDLDSFIKNSAKDMRPKIKPLPEVKPYLALQYNADGKLSDPFRSRKASSKSGTLQPNMNRPKEPMEAYPLESIKYVGQLSKVKLTYALLLTPDNGVQQVKVGNYVGQNFGMITKITDSEVELKEIVQDELSGDWIERVSNLPLQE
jgi:type IV pilus assembly protein PilP